MLNKTFTLFRICTRNTSFVPKFLFSQNKNQDNNNKPIKFQELLESNTPQSLKTAAKMIVDLQNQKKNIENQKKEIFTKIGWLDKNYQDYLKKYEILKQNSKNQKEQIQLIKKRAARQLQNAKDFSITKMAKQIIEVADNLKKCSALVEKHYKQNKDQFALGLLQCNNLLIQILDKYQIKQFDPTGQIYDPNTQQSMVQVPDPSKPNNSVAMTTVTGYKIRNRLLRSAKVCVYKS